MDLNARRKRPAAATDEDRDVLCPRRRGVDLFPRSRSRRPSCAPVCPWPISIRPEARPFRALPGLGVLKRVICWNLRPDTLFARQNYGRIGVAHLAAKEACGAPSKDTCRKNVWESVMSYRRRRRAKDELRYCIKFGLAVHLDDLESEGYGIYRKAPRVNRPSPCRSIGACPSRSIKEEVLKWKDHLASP